MMEQRNSPNQTNPKENIPLAYFFSILFFTLTFMVTSFAAGMDVSNFAGKDNVGKTDGPQADATFNAPYGLAVDRDGGIIVADSTNNLIRKILNGKVTTIAGVSDKLNSFGQPKGGFADGNALEARFNNPRYISVSANGNIYISDTGNNLIRKLSGGQVTTLAGIGKSGYTDGERKLAAFNCPAGLAVDKNENVYVADSLNHVIRVVAPSGKISTYAGKNSPTGGYKDGTLAVAEFNEPSDLAFGKDGALYVLDAGNQMVRKLYKGQVTTICGKNASFIPGTTYMNSGLQDGYGIDAKVNFPKGLFIDKEDTLYIADTWNNVIRALNKNGKLITIAGIGNVGNQNGTTGTATFNGPSDVVLVGSNLYVTDIWNNSIRVIGINPKKLVGLTLSTNPAVGITFKKKSSTPQIWVNGKAANMGKKDFKKKKNDLYISLQAAGKASGGKVSWTKGGSTLTITKGDKVFTFNIKKAPVIMVSGVPMMEVRLLADIMELGSYSVPEYNAMVLYVK